MNYSVILIDDIEYDIPANGTPAYLLPDLMCAVETHDLVTALVQDSTPFVAQTDHAKSVVRVEFSIEIVDLILV